MNNKILLLVILCMLSTQLYATWGIESATGQVCVQFNASVATTGLLSDDWYDVAVLHVEHNGTFWNSSSIVAYHNGSSTQQPVFQFADNGTHTFFFVPVVSSLDANEIDTICIYIGGPNDQSLANVAPYRLGYGNYTELIEYLSPSTYGGTYYNITQDGVYTNISTDGIFGYQRSSLPSSYENTEFFTKMNPIDTSQATDRIGGWIGYNLFYSSGNGHGVGIYDGDYAQAWYQDLSPDFVAHGILDEWRITRGAINRTGSGYGSVYFDNYTLNGTDTSSVGSSAGNLNYAYPLYVRNAEAQFEWGIMFDYFNGISNWSIQTTIYEYINPNISVQTPSWGNSFTTDDSVLLRVQYLNTGFDYCNLSLNGYNFKNYSTLAPDQITNDILDSAHMNIGNNEIIINCSLSGAPSHRYWYFTRTGADASELFDSAFGINIDTMCGADVISALSGCFEYYKLEAYYNFSAVTCQDLNDTIDYTCLGLTNRTKNDYTVYWSPATWSYDADEDIPHIGAIFYYSGAPLNSRIELYDEDKFMYIPAQDKLRDCEIYYSSNTDGCSFWNGFTVNDRHVLISDANNNWFIAGTAGLVDYNISYSQLVIPTSVLPVTPETGAELFSGGIFTRANCLERDGYYVINIVNTIQQIYSVTVIGNTSYSYSFTSAAISDNISTNGTTTISVTAGNKSMCEYNSGQLLFLPFTIPNISIDGFEIVLWVVLLFATIVSAVIPFAMFIVVIINDTYTLLNPTQIGLVAVFAIVAGLVNNVHNMDRGIKHIIIIVAIVAAYLSALSSYEDELGLTFSGYIDLITQFRDMASSTSLWDFTFNLAGFIISLFILIITLPAQFIGLVYDLVYIISPTLYTSAMPFKDILAAGFMVYFYLKAYEVISNKFQRI